MQQTSFTSVMHKTTFKIVQQSCHLSLSLNVFIAFHIDDRRQYVVTKSCTVGLNTNIVTLNQTVTNA